MSKPLERPIILLDRNLGRRIVPEKLRTQSLVQVEIHDDHFPPDAPDEQILREAGKNRWLFITKDRRIRYSGLAKNAIRDSRASCFIIATRGDLTGEEIAEIILTALKGMLQFAERHHPPFMASIDRQGQIQGPLLLD